MPRLPRIDIPHIPQHIIQRGNNRQPVFFHEDDYTVYQDFLREGLVKNNCKLYAYVQMTNHVHLLVSGNALGAVSGLMQSIGRRYVRYINATYSRTGTLFEGRFKASMVESETYLLTCMRYIELNPVRAGMVKQPDDYPWSSYAQHIAKSNIDWISEPVEYHRLGLTAELRALAYQALCKQKLATFELDAIRAHLNKDRVLGSSHFQDKIELVLGRQTRIVPQGRPKTKDFDKFK
ncbi:transposase [Methylomonas sp. AM2-LC]|uniref:transposase n=1 Tax=Methylomonas sp. AM2-LC TaxID=3153301 RepID=UPI003266F7E1